MRTWSVVLTALSVGLAACGEPEPPPAYNHVVRTRVFHIDQKFRSMLGPTATGPFLLSPDTKELLWITAYRTRVVSADGKSPADPELLCHTNLEVQAGFHQEAFGWNRPVQHGRIFTTSQGQFAVELPPGFGIPVLSDEPMMLNTQVLNHNIEHPDLDVRHEITVKFMRDADVRGRIEPLFLGFGMAMALIEGEHGVFGVDEPTAEQLAASCELGLHAPGAATKSMLADRHGRKFTQHWVVPPGREVRHTPITNTLNLPFDTTAHFIAVHLHPFAESLELRDLTTGETVYKSIAHPPSEGIGLAAVDFYASTEGLPLYRDHEYEMVSVYDNTTGENQDAMATFFLYLRDHDAQAGLDRLRAELDGHVD